jgi:hypothetical protein
MELLPQMLPISQSGMGKAASCEVGIDQFRLTYSRDSSGVLHLRSLGVITVFDANLPQASSPGSCAALKQYAIPASGNPAFVRDGGDATYMGQCIDNVLAPSPRPSDRLVWGVVEDQLVPRPLPHGVPCWLLNQFLGPPGDGKALTFVQCYLG